LRAASTASGSGGTSGHVETRKIGRLRRESHLTLGRLLGVKRKRAEPVDANLFLTTTR
jgi:hypothetical protein